jgi:putative ABC transport system permease protein
MNEFSGAESIQEECHEQRWGVWLEDLGKDIRFGGRQLWKNPIFSTVAVVTLALGIGANAAIFSVVNAVLLKALPYRDADRIVLLWTDNPALNLGFHELPPAPPDLIEWRREARSFEQIAAFRTRLADLSEEGDPERVGGVQVTANFFPMLGAQPLLGRTFATEEEQPGTDKVAVISHELWQRRFGGEPGIVGRPITINHERHTVIGVMPPRFNFPRGAEMPAGYALMRQTDVWRPYADTAEYWRNDDTRDFIAMGRLKAGVSLTRAQAEMTTLARLEAEAYPKSHAGWTIHLLPLARQVTGQARPALLVLLGAVAFVLLIACANVANLLLCRSAARRREIAVRAAIGAGRGRLIRQLLTESVLLGILGGGLGLVLGAWGVRGLLAFSPPNISRLSETTLDWRVMLFASLVSLLTGVIFGLVPAWRVAKLDSSATLNTDSRASTASGPHRTHGWLVVGEVALAVILLMGAGLMTQSLVRLEGVDLGFKPQRVAAFDVGLNGAQYSSAERQRQFYREALKRLSATPGVGSVAAISDLPLGGVENLFYFYPEGMPAPPVGNAPLAENRKITSGYFQTMGVSLVLGRDFGSQDTADQLKVCIVNESVRRQFFAGIDPIGKRIRLNGTGDEHPWWTVVGVARDVRSYGLDTKPRPQIYTAIEQNTENEMTFVVRAEGLPASALERTLRATMKPLDPALPLANFRTMESLMASAVARPRFSALVLGWFAAAALLLTAVGLYGVVAYATSQRTREIGLRVALGAGAKDVLALIIGQGLRPVIIGLVIGVPGALLLARFLRAQLYEVSPADPVTLLGTSVVLVVVALVACWLPARRAVTIDPMTALRHE